MHNESYKNTKINHDYYSKVSFNTMICGVTGICWPTPMKPQLSVPKARLIQEHNTLNDHFKVGDTVDIMSGTITKDSAQITISENIMGIILRKIKLEIGDDLYEVYEVLTGDEKSLVFEEFLKHAVT